VQLFVNVKVRILEPHLDAAVDGALQHFQGIDKLRVFGL
jgi:hypothetical protein